jgi:hypothetical protein
MRASALEATIARLEAAVRDLEPQLSSPATQRAAWSSDTGSVEELCPRICGAAPARVQRNHSPPAP